MLLIAVLVLQAVTTVAIVVQAVYAIMVLKKSNARSVKDQQAHEIRMAQLDDAADEELRKHREAVQMLTMTERGRRS